MCVCYEAQEKNDEQNERVFDALEVVEHGQERKKREDASHFYFSFAFFPFYLRRIL